MTYDPIAYWQAAGADRENTEHEDHFRRTETFARQEDALMGVLSGLEFGSILEVGCGWGRVTKLVHERWPTLPYYAFDLSAERIASARGKAPGVEFGQATLLDFDTYNATAGWNKWDLVLTVECLMHIKPDDMWAAVQKLSSWSSRYVVSLDWATPLGDTPIAPWNFLHPYREFYAGRLISVTPTDLQAIFVARVLQSDAMPA